MSIRAGEIHSVHVERLGNIGMKDWRTREYPNLKRSYLMLESQQVGPVSIAHPFRVRPHDLGLKGEGDKLICPKISGTVARNDKGVEMVTLKVGDREISLPRKISLRQTDGKNMTIVDGVIEVGADPEVKLDPEKAEEKNFPPRSVHSIIFSVLPGRGEPYDRGLAYIRTGEEPIFTFDLNPNHGLSAEELTKLHVAAMNKAVDTLKVFLDTGI